MAASILLEAGVDEVTHDTIPHVTFFADTVTLQTHTHTDKHHDASTTLTVKQLVTVE